MHLDPSLLDRAAATVTSRWPDFRPTRAVICGSGWGSVVEVTEVLEEIPYQEIPGFGATGVKGHKGSLSACRLGGVELLIFQGRRHFYEGDGWTPVATPIAIAKAFQVKQLLITNSAGCINPDFTPGDLMVISDHINFIGDNPLAGPHRVGWGPRFPDQSTVYNPDGQKELHAAAERIGLRLQSGVYLAARGPVYETPAEIRMFASLGADAVGMSTVPEAQLGSAAGLTVNGISCMTNFAAGILNQPLTHAEVTDTTKKTMPQMQALLKSWIEGV